MADPTPAVRLDHLPTEEVLQRLGELVRVSLQQKGACILVTRGTGQVTILDPDLLLSVPLEDMAEALLASWSEPEVEAFLLRQEERKDVS